MSGTSSTGQPDRLLSAKQAAEMLGVNRATVINWARRGLIPALQYGPRSIYRFRESDLIAFMERSRLPLANEEPEEQTS